MVGDHHELGEGGSSHDSVIGGLELGDHEVDVLGAVVIAGAEGDGRVARPTRVDPAPGMMP